MTATIDEAIAALRAGHLVVLPTDTQYAVVADAFSPAAVNALRAAKSTPADVALPVGVGSLETAHGVAVLEGLALDLAAGFWPGPLTMLVRSQGSLTWNLGGGDDCALAIRVPGSSLAQDVLSAMGPCVMTGVGGAKTLAAAKKALGDQVVCYLSGGTLAGAHSSVVDATGDHLRLVREGALTLSALREVVPMVVKAAS